MTLVAAVEQNSAGGGRLLWKRFWPKTFIKVRAEHSGNGKTETIKTC